MIRTYSELIKYDSFEERFEYLKLNGLVCEETFGFDRYINQEFYRSIEWNQVRDFVIIRDNACDLGICDRQLNRQIIVHHMNPISKKQLLHREAIILDPEFLISTSPSTHNAIHYGSYELLRAPLVQRYKNDTIPWKKG